MKNSIFVELIVKFGASRENQAPDLQFRKEITATLFTMSYKVTKDNLDRTDFTELTE